jgi:hypothetical protein
LRAAEQGGAGGHRRPGRRATQCRCCHFQLGASRTRSGMVEK